MGGFDLHQVYRDGKWAIYRQSKAGHTAERYEVVKILAHRGFTKRDTFFPPAECYPRPESWGTHGFTCQTYEAALARLRKVA